MTSVSTFAAAVATPFLVKLLVGSLVPVNAASLMLSTLQVASTSLILAVNSTSACLPGKLIEHFLSPLLETRIVVDRRIPC